MHNRVVLHDGKLLRAKVGLQHQRERRARRIVGCEGGFVDPGGRSHTAGDACRGGDVGGLLDDPSGFGVVGDGAILVPLGSMRKAAVLIGAVVLGVDLDCLGVVGNRAVVVALGGVRAAAIEVGSGVSGIDLE